MKIKQRYFLPKIIDIEADLLELFENITEVHFLNAV